MEYVNRTNEAFNRWKLRLQPIEALNIPGNSPQTKLNIVTLKSLQVFDVEGTRPTMQHILILVIVFNQSREQFRGKTAETCPAVLHIANVESDFHELESYEFNM